MEFTRREAEGERPGGTICSAAPGYNLMDGSSAMFVSPCNEHGILIEDLYPQGVLVV